MTRGRNLFQPPLRFPPVFFQPPSDPPAAGETFQARFTFRVLSIYHESFVCRFETIFCQSVRACSPPRRSSFETEEKLGNRRGVPQPSRLLLLSSRACSSLFDLFFRSSDNSGRKKKLKRALTVLGRKGNTFRKLRPVKSTARGTMRRYTSCFCDKRKSAKSIDESTSRSQSYLLRLETIASSSHSLPSALCLETNLQTTLEIPTSDRLITRVVERKTRERLSKIQSTSSPSRGSVCSRSEGNSRP